MTFKKGFILVFVLTIIDQISKYLVISNMAPYEQIKLLPFLSLLFAFNEGVAFSMLSGFGAWPLILMTIAIIIFVLWICKNTDAERWISLYGYAFVLAGAFGNLIDRIRIGKVVDMIFFHIDAIGFRFAIFNLADVFITLGAMAIILDEFIQWRHSRVNDTDKEIKND